MGEFIKQVMENMNTDRRIEREKGKEKKEKEKRRRSEHWRTIRELGEGLGLRFW